MTSLLGRIFKDVLWWGVPVAMVLLFTVGFYPMIAFCLMAGTGRAVLRHRSDRSLLQPSDKVRSLPPTMVALLVVGSVAITPRAVEAEEMYTVEVSVCVDQRTGGEDDCSTWETIKMGLKCATCAGGVLACPSLVAAAIATPNPGTIGLALGTCAAGAWACMECAEDLFDCGYVRMAKEALVAYATIQSSTCPLRHIYEAVCNYIDEETGQQVCPQWPWWLGC